MIELREISIENIDAVLALEVSQQQKHLVASNEKSLAQALVYKDLAWYRAVYAQGHPAGFVMLYLEPGKSPYLWRLMIDHRHQGKGLGTDVVAAIAAALRAEGHAELTVSCVEGALSPIPFYEGLGFHRTGQVNEDGETLLALPLR